MVPAPVQDRDAGFSLVETLASLVIVAMIGMMILAGLGTGRRVWERVDTREAIGEQLDAAQTALRDRLEALYPATLYDKSPPYIDFHGSSGKLVFLANPPEAQRPGALRRYTLGLNTRGQLVLLQVSDVAPPGTRPSAQVLLEGVRAFDIAYFGAAEPDQTRGWRRQWEGEVAPPEVIRIRVAFEPGDPRVWPDLLIRPRATIDTECLLNPITHACKGRT